MSPFWRRLLGLPAADSSASAVLSQEVVRLPDPPSEAFVTHTEALNRITVDYYYLRGWTAVYTVNSRELDRVFVSPEEAYTFRRWAEADLANKREFHSNDKE